MIIQPRKELILQPHMHVGMRGFLRVQILRPDGRIRWDSGFFPNRILDSGRNNMTAQASWLTWCHVGTGSTPPTALDTQLQIFTVATNTVVSNIDSTQGTAPYFGWRRKTFRFAIGAGHGGQNISEAGIGWAAAGSVLVSRALIIDPDTQQTTTVTPLADELMDVTYELRYYPPLTDVINSVVLAGTTYTTTTRAANVTAAAWSDNIGQAIGMINSGQTYWKGYNDVIGTITQVPNGTSANSDGTGYNVTYANNSYARRIGTSVGPNGWWLAGGLRSLWATSTLGDMQTQLDSSPGGASVPKTDLYTMIFEWILSWSSAAPEFNGTIATQAWSVGVDPAFDVSGYFTNAPAPIVWSLFSGTLPSGVSINSSTGVIEGTPPSPESGVCVIQCTNAVGQAISNQFSWSTT